MKGEPATESRLPRAALASLEGASLLVMAEDGAYRLPLVPGAVIVVGRSEQCDVHVDDPRLSRRHLTLRVDAGGGVTVTDLGTTNGTSIGERRLEPNAPTPVAPGEMVAIGATVLVVQSRTPAARPWRLATHDELRARLAAECVRAKGTGGFGEAFALVKLEFQSARDADAIEDVLGDSLRKKDLVAIAGPGVYEVLLPETSDITADALASRVAALLNERGVESHMHVAIYPRDGDDPEMLLDSEGAPPSRRLDAERSPRGSIFVGVAMRALEPILDKIAAGTINVLVLGETGAGKEVVARTIHVRSPRSSKPLLCINCAALSESLLESELFGHEKGAFTGAVSSKEGLLESAQGGSVFLDEVGEMPLSLQAKLLRVLEQREVLRVGSLKPRAIDVRFVAATNRDLEEECLRGRFRQDLFFRLNGISVTVPPLRERGDAIEPIAKEFLELACKAAGRTSTTQVSAQAMALLKRYAWPGNVRELKNVIERAVLLAGNETITLEHLPCDKMSPVVSVRTAVSDPGARTQSIAHTLPPAGLGTAPMFLPGSRGQAYFAEERSTLVDRAAFVRPERPASSTPEEDRARIVAALDQCAGNQTRAAKLLGISRRTLVTRLSTYDLPRPRPRKKAE